MGVGGLLFAVPKRPRWGFAASVVVEEEKRSMEPRLRRGGARGDLGGL